MTFVDKPLVFDTPCLGHHARTDRLDVLQALLVGTECWITGVVIDELRIGAEQHPAIASALGLEWLTIAQQDTVDELTEFARWTRRLGNGPRNHGEASVFALAERLDAIAIVDDREAVRTGRAYGLSVHGTIWLLAAAFRAGKMTLVEAGNLIDALRATDMRLPCTGLHRSGVSWIRRAAWPFVAARPDRQARRVHCDGSASADDRRPSVDNRWNSGS